MPKRRQVDEDSEIGSKKSKETDDSASDEEGEEGELEGDADSEAPSAGEGESGSASGEASTGGMNGEMQRLRTAKFQLEMRVAELTDDKTRADEVEEVQTKEIKRLESLNAANSREIERLMVKCGEKPGDGTLALSGDGVAGPAALGHQPGPVRSLASSAPNPSHFGLALILPPDHTTATLPHTYKGTEFHFPHRIQMSKAGTRQFVIESRLLVHVACQLRYTVGAGRKATEIDLPVRGDLFFRLEVCYANSGAVVQTEELKHKPAHLLEPPGGGGEPSGKQKMSQGELKWRFHCKFLSRNTKPTGQEFLLRISCLNPELAAYDLEAQSPPFLIISREVKTKAGASE